MALEKIIADLGIIDDDFVLIKDPGENTVLLDRQKSLSSGKILKILQSKWIVFGYSGCPYYEHVKDLLSKNLYTFEDLEILESDYSRHIQFLYSKVFDALVDKNYRTWPRIFHAGKFIGGASDVEKYIETIKSHSCGCNH